MRGSPYEYLAALVPPTVLIISMLRLLLRPDVRLLARRRIDSDGVHYVFAVHNADEVPLEGQIVIRVETVLKAGELLPEPILLCGPSIKDVTTTDFKKEGPSHYTVTTPRLRSQSTWIVMCSTNKKEGDLRLTVTYKKRESSSREEKWSRLGSSREILPTAGQWRWMVSGTLLALLTYMLPTQFLLSWPRQMETLKLTVDGVLIGVLLCCSALAFWMCRPRPGPVILGHMRWTQDVGKPPAAGGPPAEKRS